MASVKKVSKAGGITLPLEMRRGLNIQPGDRLEVITNEAGQLVLKRYSAHCMFCDDGGNVVMFKGKPVCCGCLESIRQGGVNYGIQ